MKTMQPKKMIPLIILEILNKYSDEDHHLSQKQIEDYLMTKYGMNVERKTVKRSIMDLIDMGVNIEYTETFRTFKDKKTGVTEKQSVLSGFYINREFTDIEIRLLIDGLIDSDFIPANQRKDLISKLENLSSIYYRRTGSCVNDTGDGDAKNELFHTIDVVDEAISEGRKISFLYRKYVTGEDGLVNCEYEEHTAAPYYKKMGGRNYLLYCSEDGVTETAFRLDYIIGISKLVERSHVPALRHTDNKRTLVFASDESMLTEFVEEFGQDSIRTEVHDNGLKLYVKAAETKAVDFALRNTDRVTALAPESFRCKVYDVLYAGWERYGNSA